MFVCKRVRVNHGCRDPDGISKLPIWWWLDCSFICFIPGWKCILTLTYTKGETSLFGLVTYSFFLWVITSSYEIWIPRNVNARRNCVGALWWPKILLTPQQKSQVWSTLPTVKLYFFPKFHIDVFIIYKYNWQQGKNNLIVVINFYVLHSEVSI